MTDICKKKIQEWAASQKGNLVQDLIELVNIPSVSDSESKNPPFGSSCQAALAWMLDKGRSLDCGVHNYDGYAGSISLNKEEQNPEQTIGIWCHLDVVPAGEGWQTHPFEAFYQDGLVTGRGSQDNKSAAIMGLYVLKGLKELHIKLRHPVALYFGINEECGMQDLDYFLAHFPAPGLSLIADCGFPACYGEKGALTVTFSSKEIPELLVKELAAGIAHNTIPGLATLSLEQNGSVTSLSAHGLAGHSAFPAGSKNAIPLLLKQVLNLPELSSEAKEALIPLYKLSASTDGSPAGINKQDLQYGDLTCCGTILNWENGIWKMTFDIRYPHSVSSDFLLSQLTQYGRQTGLTFEVVGHLPSFGFSPDHPVIQKLTEVYNRENGSCSEAYAMAGGTYAAKLPNAIPFGISFPDKSAIYQKFPKGHGDYHQPDESVEVDQIIRALGIYLIALAEIDEIE
jgi:succinyl-diaminopimelate desuccinylase